MIKLLPGDVFFVMHHNNWLSKTIAWFMGSKFSHCAVVLEQTNDRTYTMETTNFEVVPNIIERYFKDDQTSVTIMRKRDMSLAYGQAVAREATLLNGLIYGYLQLFSLGVRRLLMRVGIKINNFIRTGLVCCHVVTKAYKVGPIKELAELDDESIDTQELYELLEKLGFDVILIKDRNQIYTKEGLE